jgi:hypothetical protein
LLSPKASANLVGFHQQFARGRRVLLGQAVEATRTRYFAVPGPIEEQRRIAEQDMYLGHQASAQLLKTGDASLVRSQVAIERDLAINEQVVRAERVEVSKWTSGASYLEARIKERAAPNPG